MQQGPSRRPSRAQSSLWRLALLAGTATVLGPLATSFTPSWKSPTRAPARTGTRDCAIIAVRLRDLENGDVAPPPARMPREKRMTEVEKKADAVVHAVVAVELLSWHGKLAGSLESAFKKSVYLPVMPRLGRLMNRQSAEEEFRIDASGKKRSRPSRMHDSALEAQYTLGYIFTGRALQEMGRTDNADWMPMARYRSRQELMLAEAKSGDDPVAKDLVAWGQGTFKVDGQEIPVATRSVGHNDAQETIWILPVFVDHDRAAHAERQAILTMLNHLPTDDDEGVKKGVTGAMRVYASHTPCISCVTAMAQLTRAFEGAKLSVMFDQWKETRRWIGLSGPAELPDDDEYGWD